MKRVDEIQHSNVLLRGLARLEKRMDKISGFEAMGVERVPEDERKPPEILNVSIPFSFLPYRLTLLILSYR